MRTPGRRGARAPRTARRGGADRNRPRSGREARAAQCPNLADQARVSEREPDDERLLLAGRGGAGQRLLGPCQTMRSLDAARPGSGRRRRRGRGCRAGSRGSGSSAASAGAPSVRASISPSSASLAHGKGDASSRSAAINASSRRTHSSRTAVTATPSSAASRSIASSHAALRPPSSSSRLRPRKAR